MVASSVVPLILIAATLDAGLLERWTAKLRLSRSEKGTGNSKAIKAYMIFVGWSMLATGFTSLLFSLWEIYRRVNYFDSTIFVTTVYITLGIAISFFHKILLAADVKFGLFNTTHKPDEFENTILPPEVHGTVIE